MKYLVLTGNHPRHLFYLNSIAEYCNLVGAVLEKREDFLPSPANNLNKIDYNNFIRHFKNRERVELEYFGEKKIPSCPIHYFESQGISQGKTIEFINKASPDVIFVFGVLEYFEKIKSSILCDMVINLNTGLIQRYDGDATLFWPFYFLEPNWAGSTFHLLKNREFFDIIHQCIPVLESKDTIHKVAAKVVLQSSKEVAKIIAYLEKNKGLKTVRFKKSGKNFSGDDFSPQHLRIIYNLFNDDIVDKFLKKDILSKKPKLIRLKNE